MFESRAYVSFCYDENQSCAFKVSFFMFEICGTSEMVPTCIGQRIMLRVRKIKLVANAQGTAHRVFMRRIRPTTSVVETPSVRGMDLNFPEANYIQFSDANGTSSLL